VEKLAIARWWPSPAVKKRTASARAASAKLSCPSAPASSTAAYSAEVAFGYEGRMKGDLARLGVNNFNPKLKKAPAKLDAVRTPEGGPIPPNTIAKLKRDMERLRQTKEQIRQIEAERLERIKKAPEEKAHVMIVLLASVLGMGVETADMLARPS
jgi:transposase